MTCAQHALHTRMTHANGLSCSWFVLYIWWPRMDSNIEEIVRSCYECAAQGGLPPVAPLHSWPWANQPI